MMDKVRIDKWLWAARFFKTRSLAKTAIEKGRVKVDGQRVKPSREISVGVELLVQIGWDDKTVKVEALSDQRRGAPEATALYTETSESIVARQDKAAQRRAYYGLEIGNDKRPSKKDRRQIHRFKQQDYDL